MKKLVAFYSRANENYFGGQYRYIEVGNTEKIAKMIAEYTGADLFKIVQKFPYAADYNTCITEAKRDAKSKARPELVGCIESIDSYDEIYLGFPNYWGTMPMAVFTFLEKFDWNGKTIHPFITHEGSGFGNSESDIKNTCHGAKLVKGLAVRGSRVDTAMQVVREWI